MFLVSPLREMCSNVRVLVCWGGPRAGLEFRVSWCLYRDSG